MLHSIKTTFSVLALLYTISFNLIASTYYVSTTGDDSNDGSVDNPWKTVQKAAETVVAGDEVFIARGTYEGDVEIANTGQADAWITFDALPGDEGLVVLDNCEFRIHQRSYIRVSGLKVQNGDHGFKVVGPSSNITISNNHTYDTYGSGIIFWGVEWQSDPGDYNNMQDIKILNNKVEKACNGGWNECITIANGIVGFEIAYNEIFNGGDPTNGGEGIDIKIGISEGSVHHNYLHGLTRRGIYLDAAGILSFEKPITKNIDIYNNIVHDCEGQGIAIMTEGKGDVHSINVYNNLLYNNTEDGIMIYKHPQGTGKVYNCLMINNTIWNNPRYGILINFTGGEGLDIHNNIIYENGTEFFRKAGTGVESDNLIGEDPLFISENDENFRLQANSPAIDAGTTNNAPDFDLDSNLRDNLPDIGSYEFIKDVNATWTTNHSKKIRVHINRHNDLVINGLDAEPTANYNIVNLAGNVVQQGVVNSKGNSKLYVALEDFKTGIYFVKVQTPSWTDSKPFVFTSTN